jgi:hypothetical protein
MSDKDEDLEQRLWRGTVAFVVCSVLVSLFLFNWRVITGLLLGGCLAIFNHRWLKSSLKAIFGKAAATGEKPNVGASKFLFRYFVVGSIVAVAYWLNLVSMPATLVGLCSFAFAILFEAVLRFYFAIANRGDNAEARTK